MTMSDNKALQMDPLVSRLVNPVTLSLSLPVIRVFVFFKPSAGSNQFFLLHALSDTFLLYFIKKIKVVVV